MMNILKKQALADIDIAKEESRFAGEDFIKKSIKASLLEDDEFEFHGINLKGGVSA